MSIASRITSIEGHIGNAYDSIKKFGVDTSVINRNIENIANVINDDIYDKLPKVTQSGAGFTLLDVQNGQVDDFKMNGVDLEQDTTTGKNILNIPDGTYSNNGVTAVVKDGVVTLNGTAFSGNSFIKFPFVFEFEDTKTYTLSANNEEIIGGNSYNESHSSIRFETSSGNSSVNTWCYFGTKNNSITININYSVSHFCIRTNNNLTYNNFVIKPQLEENSSSTNFEPYTGGIPSPNPDYPQQIKVVEGRQVITDKGKNLLKPHAMEGTNNGITVSYDEETRVYTFNGTCTQDNTTFVLSDKSINFIAGVTKSITYWVDGSCSGYCYIRHYDSSYSVYCNYSIVDIGANNDKIEQLSDKTFLNTSAQCSIRFNSGSVANNLQIKVMVTDDENTDYEPYYEPVSYNIDLTNDLLKYNKCDFTPTTTSWYFLDSSGSAYGSNIGTKTDIKFPVEINKKYTLRYNISIAPNTFQLCYENENVVATLGKSIGNNSFTFTSDRNGYVVPRVQVNASSQVKITGISVVKGEEDYYDYKLAKMPNTDYKNRIYKSNGNWYYEEKVKKVVLDETVDVRSVNTASSNTTRVGCYELLLNNLSKPGSNNVVCNYLKGDLIWEEDREGIYTNNADLVFRINKTTIGTTKEEVLNWLSTNNLVVWYPLKSTSVITTQITNTTLINQLEAISVHTGTNIITISSDNDMIPEIEITRLKELERLS